MSKTRIHLVDGEKGGVGKSVLSRVLIQMYLDTGTPFQAVEVDEINPDVYNIYSDCTSQIKFSRDVRTSGDEDNLIDWALKKDLIVNLPGNIQTSITQWIDRSDLLTLAYQNEIQFVQWFVVGPSYQSLELFTGNVNRYKDRPHPMIHVLVKNSGIVINWDNLKSYDKLEDILALHNACDCTLPLLDYREMGIIDRSKLTFGAAKTHSEEKSGYGIVSKQKVITWLRNSYDALGTTTTLTSLPQPNEEKKNQPAA